MLHTKIAAHHQRMGRIKKDIVDRIYNTADIVEVVSDYVQLKKRGANYVGLSPFKQEKTPSFTVSAQKRIFKDFSSGLGGSLIDFLKEIEGYSYVQALEHLARKYNIELEYEDGPGQLGPDRQQQEALQKLNDYALRFFTRKLMQSPEGQAIGLRYLQDRGFSDETIQLFQLGYAPDAWQAFTDGAKKDGFPPDRLMQMGLCGRSEKTGRLYDKYRDRVIFPIHNVSGTVVGFGGRILSKDSRGPKYLNSPETPLYNKSKELYGLFYAKMAVRELKEAILVEGYTDVISLHQAGVNNAIATCGTSLTEQHLKQLSRFTNRLLLLFDGDEAGIRASLRSIDLAIAQSFEVKVLLLPEGQDPDEFVQARGAKGFREFSEQHAEGFVEFILHATAGDEPLDNPEIRTRAIERVTNALSRIPDDLQRTVYAQHAAKVIEVPSELILEEVNRILATLQRQAQYRERYRQQDTDAAGAPSAMQGSVVPVEQKAKATPKLLGSPLALDAVEKELIRLLLNYPDGEVEFEPGDYLPLLEYFEEELDNVLELTTKPASTIFEALEPHLRMGEPFPLQRFMDEADEYTKQFCMAVLETPYHLSPRMREKLGKIPHYDEDLNALAREAINEFKYYKVCELETESMRELQNTDPKNEEQTAELVVRIKKLNHIRQMLTQHRSS